MSFRTSEDPQHVPTRESGLDSSVGVNGRNISPRKATVPLMTEFFLYLWVEFKLSVLAVKVYQATFNHVFSLAGIDLASSKIISRMFNNFEKTCPPREIIIYTQVMFDPYFLP